MKANIINDKDDLKLSVNTSCLETGIDDDSIVSFIICPKRSFKGKEKERVIKSIIEFVCNDEVFLINQIGEKNSRKNNCYSEDNNDYIELHPIPPSVEPTEFKLYFSKLNVLETTSVKDKKTFDKLVGFFDFLNKMTKDGFLIKPFTKDDI